MTILSNQSVTENLNFQEKLSSVRRLGLNIPLLVLGGVVGVRHSLSKKCPVPPPRVRHPVEGSATFKEARQDKKDAYTTADIQWWYKV